MIVLLVRVLNDEYLCLRGEIEMVTVRCNEFNRDFIIKMVFFGKQIQNDRVYFYRTFELCRISQSNSET